jgi:Flp pilus assembly protein TadB
MNWIIFLAIATIGFSVGALVTFKNRPMSHSVELNIMQSAGALTEAPIKTENAGNEFSVAKIISDIRTRSASGNNVVSSEAQLHEYLHPETQAAAAKRQKMLGLAVGSVIMAIGMLLLSGTMRMFVIAAPLIGYAVPMFLASSRTKKMRATVVDAIPDLLGYLSIFISSMSLYKCLELILSNVDAQDDNILYASLRQSLKEHQFGRDLFESLEEKAGLLGVEEWSSCVFTLNEGIKLGKDLRAVMMEVEDEYRAERRLKLEMAASQVTTKLSIVSSAMFMPSIYTFTMVPAYMKVFKVL